MNNGIDIRESNSSVEAEIAYVHASALWKRASIEAVESTLREVARRKVRAYAEKRATRATNAE